MTAISFVAMYALMYAMVNTFENVYMNVNQFYMAGLMQLLLKTDTVMVEIHLGPTAFLTERKVEIRKGDTLDVTGSRIMISESQVVLAREIRKGDNAWTLRDSTGQPLWSSSRSEARGFWTTKRVLVAIAVVKVVALATVLRH